MIFNAHKMARRMRRWFKLTLGTVVSWVQHHTEGDSLGSLSYGGGTFSIATV